MHHLFILRFLASGKKLQYLIQTYHKIRTATKQLVGGWISGLKVFDDAEMDETMVFLNRFLNLHHVAQWELCSSTQTV